MGGVLNPRHLEQEALVITGPDDETKTLPCGHRNHSRGDHSPVLRSFVSRLLIMCSIDAEMGGKIRLNSNVCVFSPESRFWRKLCEGRNFVKDHFLVAFVVELSNGICRREFQNTSRSARFVCRIEFG